MMQESGGDDVAERSSRAFSVGALAYGGDYNPDQWSERTWVEDIELMQKAGVNIVTLPVFSWPQLETAPGVYDWSWLDRIIDLLWDAGIRVDLATATATPPSWLLRRHPEMLPQDADGHTYEFGSRQTYCPSSPVWRSHVARMARAMAERYGAHPAVALWHVSNEYGDHISRCWCPESAAHFRRWLQDRYGTLDALNDAWGVNVWGQRYTAWEHVEPPRHAPGPIDPAQLLDFERFSSDALLELFRVEVDVLREVTPQVPVTTNFMSMFRQLNYWDFAAAEDLVTDDAYPDPADPTSHVGASWNYGLMRSLKGGQPWLLLEQSASAVSWRDVNVPKAPGKMRSDSMQAIAGGSDGAMFFQWRQARYGQEKFHSAMLGHRGEQSRTFRETATLGAELARLAPVRGTRVRARVAITVDWDSWWGASAAESLPSRRLDWADQVRAWHRAVYALGQPVDAVRAIGPFDGYDVVLVPNLYIATSEQAAALESFVRAGGRLVVGPFSAVVDQTETVHPHGAPGPLHKLLGIDVDEPWPLADGAVGRIDYGDRLVDNTVWSEWLVVDPETTVRGRYASGDLNGRPAVTRAAAGDGAAWYISGVLDDDGMVAVFRDVFAEVGVPVRADIDLALEAVTRSDDDTDYTFIINHGRMPLDVSVPVGAHNLITGAITGDALTLERFGVAVLSSPRAADVPFITLASGGDVTPQEGRMP